MARLVGQGPERRKIRRSRMDFPGGPVVKNLFASTGDKAMAPHSSTLAWKIPWTERPGRLQSMGSLRVGHD